MEIGLFQLENLLISRSPFLFLDLRSVTELESASLPAELQNVVAGAVRIGPAEVLGHLKGLNHDLDRPLVLLSQDGSVSEQVAAQLEAGGYRNVYVVAGGVVGLLSES